MVIPQAHHKHHTSTQGTTDGLESSLGLEVVVVFEELLLISTHRLGDGIVCLDSREGGLGVLDDLAVLDVESPDLAEVTIGVVVGSEELSHHSEGLGGINSRECLSVVAVVALTP